MISIAFILLICTAAAFKVRVGDGKCYVQAFSGSTDKLIWLDLSEYLVKDAMAVTIITNCQDYREVTQDEIKKPSNDDSQHHTVCEHQMDSSGTPGASPYFNGHHFLLFFNPCRKIDHVPQYELDGNVYDYNIEQNGKTYCANHSGKRDSSYACLGLYGQANYYLDRNGRFFSYNFDGNLLTVKPELFEDSVFEYHQTKEGYSLVFSVEIPLIDIMPTEYTNALQLLDEKVGTYKLKFRLYGSNNYENEANMQIADFGTTSADIVVDYRVVPYPNSIETFDECPIALNISYKTYISLLLVLFISFILIIL